MQLEIEEFTSEIEHPAYLSEQLITYLGNKRSLIPAIEGVVEEVRKKVGGRKLRTCDGFAGSGIVSRMLKRHSTHIHSNDFENYSAIINRTYLTNHEEMPYQKVEEAVHRLNKKVIKGGGPKGFIAEMYAPKIDTDIKTGERVFYTQENARRLDAYAQLIRKEDQDIQELLLGPLLSAASVHANTGGVFKGFYKNENGVGSFGGSGADALTRILAPIELKVPILSKFYSEANITQLDTAVLPENMQEADLVYLDPPYNQHPYGSNYFMLNLIANYRKPNSVSTVSGIPDDWQRSAYNKKKDSFSALSALVATLPARFILLSFSDDGFLEPKDLQELFKSHGEATVYDIEYNTYRASRNLDGRGKHITEHLFLLDRGK
jgi:adenine-specific DNA-methyltransferase